MLSSGCLLAQELGELGRRAEAAELHERILDIRQQLWGLEHPGVLNSAGRVANQLSHLALHAVAI